MNEDSIFIWGGANKTARTGTITGHTDEQDSTAQNTGITIVDSSATFQTWGIEPGMLLQLTHTDVNYGYGRVRSVTNETTIVLCSLAYQTDAQKTAGLGQGTDVRASIADNTTTYKIPVQLFKCKRETLPFVNAFQAPSSTASPHSMYGFSEVSETDDTDARIWLAEWIAMHQIQVIQSSDFAGLKYKDPTDNTSVGFDTITVYNSVANTHGLRLMLNLEGYIASPDCE